MLSVIRQGFTSTVIVMGLASGLIFFLAFRFEPDQGIPNRPGAIAFQIVPKHLISQPISANITVYDWGGKQVCMFFHAEGQGLGSTKWELEVSRVPASPLRNIDLSTKMTSVVNGSGSYVLSPDARQPNTADVRLCWKTSEGIVLTSRGSNTAIDMPAFGVWEVFVDENSPKKPNPPLKVTAELYTDHQDWTVDSGDAPNEHLSVPGHWVWESTTGAWDNAGGGPTAQLNVRSVNDAENEHQREFISGILFGVGAAAAVAVIQEFLNNFRHLRLRSKEMRSVREQEAYRRERNARRFIRKGGHGKRTFLHSRRFR